MKNLLYLFVSIFIVLSIHSCKRIGDKDGNLLNDMGQNDGLLGEDRFLYQEVTSADTIAEYHYTGRKLTKVIGDSTVTNISYSGELIHKIDFNGVVEGDSISYTQLFNYSVTDVNLLTNITETKKVFENIANQTTLPLVSVNTKSKYDVVFEADKLKSVVKMTGKDIPLTAFQFTSYDKTTYSYDAKNNVTKAAVQSGNVTAGALDAPIRDISFDYYEYDDKRSPYKLLPFGYLLHKTFENAHYNYRFSPHNPKRIILAGNVIPVPVPHNTLYTYDHLGFALTGWGLNYEYRPF